MRMPLCAMSLLARDGRIRPQAQALGFTNNKGGAVLSKYGCVTCSPGRGVGLCRNNRRCWDLHVMLGGLPDEKNLQAEWMPYRKRVNPLALDVQVSTCRKRARIE